jgi:hypothetical protein
MPIQLCIKRLAFSFSVMTNKSDLKLMVNDIKYDEILIAPPFTVVKSPEVTIVVAFSFLVGNTPELRGLSCAVYTGGLCAVQSDGQSVDVSVVRRCVRQEFSTTLWACS